MCMICDYISFPFLTGSGSGYLNCLAAHLLGPSAVNHGVEISAEAVTHSRLCIKQWLQHTHPAHTETHAIQIMQGTWMCNMDMCTLMCVGVFVQ
ncbi:hypothetical protein EON63_21065 [archaeon]|nr:MAG: hypothetical protein EON63_21065 [archaeon]